MKVSVFGLGSIGRRHLINLEKNRKKYKITSLNGYDLNLRKVQKFLPKSKNLNISNNFRNIASNCDVAFICAPTNLHIKVINRILKFSKPHLYLEKPFSSEIKGCKKIIKLFKRYKKKIAVGYMLVNHPVILFAKSLLNQKKIGRTLFVRAESGFYLPFSHPWENYKNFYMSSKKAGGGALLDTSHEINYLQFLFGKVQKVNGKVLQCSDLDITSDDLTLSNLTFKNGINAQIHLDLLQFDEERNFKIIGTKGVIKGDIKNNKVIYYLLKKKKWFKKFFAFNFDKLYLTQLNNFFSYIKNKKINIVDDKEAFHTMQIIESIRLSSIKKKEINISPFNKKNHFNKN